MVCSEASKKLKPDYGFFWASLFRLVGISGYVEPGGYMVPNLVISP